jgi:multisubunit Na+/H+ antiporter MnhC subunit
MNASRSITLFLGLAFLLAGAYLLYFEANLSRWVSVGILSAGVLLFIGLAVMSYASSAPVEPVRSNTVIQHDTVEKGPTTVIEDRRAR